MIGIVFFIFLNILYQTQTTEVAQVEDYPEDPSSGDFDEENDLGDEVTISYEPSSRSDTEKTTEQYNELCEQLSKFTPNLCTYAKAKERCSKYCDDDENQPGKSFLSCPSSISSIKSSIKSWNYNTNRNNM